MSGTYEVTTGKKIANWFTARMAGAGIGNFVVLTTTGRRSGEPRSVVIAPIGDADGEYLVCPYGDVAWVRNVRADPKATIRRGRSERDVTLVEVTDEKAALIRDYHRRETFARQFMDVPGEAEVSDFARVAGRFPVFRVEDRV